MAQLSCEARKAWDNLKKKENVWPFVEFEYTTHQFWK